MIDVYRITYYDLLVKSRQSYMNNAGFPLAEAKKEIILLEKQQDFYEKISFGRTRKEFEYKLIKFKE